MAALLVELANQIDSGRVYDRHLPEMASMEGGWSFRASQ
jgi:hypothetical protein